MADWSSRVGPALAVGSGLGYLLGAGVVSEFAAQLGLQAADLGVGPREYVVVALVATLGMVVLATGLLAAGALLAGGVGDAVKGRRSRGTPRVVVEVVVWLWLALFAGSLLLLAPAYLLESDPQPLRSLLFGAAVAAALGVFVVVPAALRYRGERSGEPVGPWLRGWARGHPVLAATGLALALLGVGAYSLSTAGDFGQLVREWRPDPDDPATTVRTPVLLRWVVRPAVACVRSGGPAELAGRAVVRVARTGEHTVLVRDGRAWTVPNDGLRLTTRDRCS